MKKYIFFCMTVLILLSAAYIILSKTNLLYSTETVKTDNTPIGQDTVKESPTHSWDNKEIVTVKPDCTDNPDSKDEQAYTAMKENKALNKDTSDKNKSSTEKSRTKETSASSTVSTETLTKEDFKNLPATTVINVKELSNDYMDMSFYYEPLDDAQLERIRGISYKDNPDIQIEDLRYVRLLHYGFDNQVHIGELIVNEFIAKDIVEIFKELYKASYPIEQMRLVDEYEADDNASMSANNTSAFNYRTVPGSSRLSKHALGLAIDINPLYNPYITDTSKGRSVLPSNGAAYTDRSLDNPYYIKKEDICYNAFIKHGFTWGGNWKSSKDYQHFQKVKP